MANAATLLIPLSLFTVMLALGVGMPLDAWRDWRRLWPLVLRAELATCLLVPLVGWLLLCTPPARGLSPEVRLAIALMVLCPSAPLMLRKAAKEGGDRSLTGLLQVGAALLAILTVPLLARLGTVMFAVDGWAVRPAQVAQQVAQVQLLPLLVGLLLRRLWPEPVGRLRGLLDLVANVLLVLVVLAVLIKTAPLLLGFAARNLPAVAVMALLVLISLAIGFALCSDGREQRVSTALITTMRNPGLALLLAGTYAPHLPGAKLGILLYLLITVLLSTLTLKLSVRAASKQ